jgi:hypothetical protein
MQPSRDAARLCPAMPQAGSRGGARGRLPERWRRRNPWPTAGRAVLASDPPGKVKAERGSRRAARSPGAGLARPGAGPLVTPSGAWTLAELGLPLPSPCCIAGSAASRRHPRATDQHPAVLAVHGHHHDRNRRRNGPHSRSQPSLRMLVWEFMEECRWEPDDVQPSLLGDEPSPIGDERWDTLLAALAEHLAARHDLAPPDWAEMRVLRRPWFPAETGNPAGRCAGLGAGSLPQAWR